MFRTVMRTSCVCALTGESVRLVWLFSFESNPTTSQSLGSSWTCCTLKEEADWVTDTKAGPWENRKTSWEPAFICLNALPREQAVNHGKKWVSRSGPFGGVSRCCLIIARRSTQSRPNQCETSHPPGNQTGDLATPSSFCSPWSFVSKIFVAFQRLEAWVLPLLGISWCLCPEGGPLQDEKAS